MMLIVVDLECLVMLEKIGLINDEYIVITTKFNIFLLPYENNTCAKNMR